MTTISAYLKPIDKALYFQVTDMTSNVVSFLSNTPYWQGPLGWKVALANHPALDLNNKIIFLGKVPPSRNKDVFRAWDLPSDSFAIDITNSVDYVLDSLVNAIEGNTYYPRQSVRIAPMEAVSSPNINTLGNKPLIRG